MENYKCKKCGSFLACFNDNITTFKAKRGVNIENDKIIFRCKCGPVSYTHLTLPTT